MAFRRFTGRRGIRRRFSRVRFGRRFRRGRTRRYPRVRIGYRM